jgi:uncharacterized membrane-anchored protein
MKKYKWIIIIANLVIVLFLFNRSLVQKEELLANGKLILLELAPVDPRSLMQGDYMVLRYKVSSGIDRDSISKRGYFVVKSDSVGVGQRVRIQDGTTPINEDELLLNYTVGNRRLVNIGAESYFFEEGQAGKYSKAKYGALKVDDQGNTLLIGLYDEKRELIK